MLSKLDPVFELHRAGRNGAIPHQRGERVRRHRHPDRRWTTGNCQILSPMYGTPAYRAGLLAGDRILEIDGKSTDGLTLDEAVERLKGEEGTR